VELPDATTNQTHDLILEINPGTNAVTIATNNLVLVYLSTNQVFQLPASRTTTCTFHKGYHNNFWEGWSLTR